MNRILRNVLRWMKGKMPIKVFGRIEKRIRFVISSSLLTAILLLSTFFSFEYAWFFIPIFIAASYFFTFFSLLDDIEGVEWGTLFILPVIFTLVIYIFYFLFPVRWLTRLPYMFIYLISMYALFLTSNIFNVGVEKSLRLYKAAFSVNYFFQTFLIFIAANVIFSLRELFLVNALGVGIISVLLAGQLFWTIKLDLQLSSDVRRYALFIGVIMAQVAILLSFVPMRTSVLSLVLASTYYSLGGLTSASLDNRLFKSTIREYAIVLISAWAIATITLSGW